MQARQVRADPAPLLSSRPGVRPRSSCRARTQRRPLDPNRRHLLYHLDQPRPYSAPSPLRQNAGEIARLRREIKALALQLGLSSAELDAVEDDAERFVRSQDPSPSPSVSTSQPSSATPKPPPRKRPSIPKPLAAPVVPAPAPAPRAPSPPEQQDPEQQPEPDASYYKRGFSTAGWGSWDRKEPTWAAAPPGPRRYEPTPGWAAPAAGGPAYEFQPPPQAGLQPSFQRAYGPGEDVRPHGYHAYAMSPPGFAQPPKPLSPVVPHPHSPALHPHSPSLPSLASVVDEIEQQAEVDLPPIRRSPPGSGEKRPSVALPSIGAWFAPGHEGERMEE